MRISLKAKKQMALFLAFLMLIITLLASISYAAVETKENNFKPRSINPGTNSILEYRFYETKEKAEAAVISGNPDLNTPEPKQTQRVAKYGMLSHLELIEEKDKLFDGWYYKDEKGNERKIEFESPVNVPEKIKGSLPYAKDNIGYIYAYPKYQDVNAVFFTQHHTVISSETADEDKEIMQKQAPAVKEEGKIFCGWSVEEEVASLEEAKNKGILFKFKEDHNPTKVEGSKILHAILEPGIQINFDTKGGEHVPAITIDPNEDKAIPSPS